MTLIDIHAPDRPVEPPPYVCKLMIADGEITVMSAKWPSAWKRFWVEFLTGWKWRKL